ncbi:hypothetical protein V8F20_006612 [Naviculisporaceae sp. PSN 640]
MRSFGVGNWLLFVLICVKSISPTRSMLRGAILYETCCLNMPHSIINNLCQPRSNDMSGTSNPERPTPTLWHHVKAEIRKALDAGYQPGQEGFDKVPLPWVKCPICRDEIVLPGIPPHTQHHQKNMWILCCGHMICHGSMCEGTIADTESCPLCKAPQEAQSLGCHHYSGRFLLPSEFLESAPDLRTLIDIIPKTIPEGGQMPQLCPVCWPSPEEKDFAKMVEEFEKLFPNK